MHPRLSSFKTALVIVTLVSISACASSTQAVKQAQPTPTIMATSTVQPFDPSVGAPLPNYRLVTAYGITGGVSFNGPASTLGMLSDFLPQLQDLGNQYAALDPVHPVKLGIDLVVSVIQPCAYYSQWCSSFVDDDTLQAYVDFCKEHDLYLFFDLQLGTEPVADAVQSHLMPYLQQYPFTELALDTEFHFPNNAQGYAEAAAYPGYLGWMDASEINWAITTLANISVQSHLPRKVLVVHQWAESVIHNKDQVQRNPGVSLVLQSDGWGGLDNKLGDYQVFVQQNLLEYGGYKLFFQHDGDSQYDYPLQSPSDVMNLFPQPLFISYQ